VVKQCQEQAIIQFESEHQGSDVGNDRERIAAPLHDVTRSRRRTQDAKVKGLKEDVECG
jgi:hypothetical protein